MELLRADVVTRPAEAASGGLSHHSWSEAANLRRPAGIPYGPFAALFATMPALALRRRIRRRRAATLGLCAA